MSETDRRSDQVRRWLLVGGMLAIAYAVIRAAWISDDALLNVRTALNVAHDNGAVYNVGERVQIYTSPLWFWLSFIVGFVTDEYVVGTLLLGVVCSLAAMFLILRTAASVATAAVGLGIVLLSPIVIDYSTSGLENPLGYLFVVVLVALVDRRPLQPVLVGGVAGALLLTRLDFALLIAPLAVGVIWQHRREVRTLAVATVAALVPLATWHGIAIVYYGSALPNSFEAKTNLDISRGELLVAGLRYVIESVEFDRIGGLAFVVLLVVLLARGGTQRLVASGCLLYVAYVVWVGGDFMAGRFLAVPFVFALAMWVRSGSIPSVPPTTVPAVAVAAVVVLLGMGATSSGVFAERQRGLFDLTGAGVVVDEASFYRGLNYDIVGSLDELSRPEGERTGLWRLRNNEKQWRTFAPPDVGLPRAVEPKCGGLGGLGLERGPGTHMLDTCGLADPVIARLPFRPVEPHAFRAGHYDRGVPDGYLDALTLADPSLVVDDDIRALVIDVWADLRP